MPKSPPPGFSLSLSLVYGSRNVMHDEYALVQINLQVKRRSLRRGLIIDLNAAVRALAHQRYEAGYIIPQTRAHDARHPRRPRFSPLPPDRTRAAPGQSVSVRAPPAGRPTLQPPTPPPP